MIEVDKTKVLGPRQHQIQICPLNGVYSWRQSD